jgi:predicted RNase H-like HicB family nuclease
MTNILHFYITKEDSGYSAEAVNFPIVTQADTLDDLEVNIKEATDLYLEGVEENTISKNPSILLNYQIPAYA